MTDILTPVPSNPAVNEADAVSAVRGLSPAERPMVAEYDQTQIHRNLYELFADAAAAQPDAVAVIGPDATLTYSALAERALQVSTLLHHRGIVAEQPVGVFMSRTADVVAVLLGILHAGGCYVPLDPAEPAERARFVATDRKSVV